MVAAVLFVGLLAVEPASPLQDSSAPAVAVATDQAPQSSSHDSSAEKKPPTPPHTGMHALFFGLIEDAKHLPSVDNAKLAGLGGGLSLIAHPLDDNFNIRLRSHYNGVNQAFRPG